MKTIKMKLEEPIVIRKRFEKKLKGNARHRTEQQYKDYLHNRYSSDYYYAIPKIVKRGEYYTEFKIYFFEIPQFRRQKR